ncbi:MAG TPA: helix-turn-helix domain-containing protein [Gemmatimonadaceae bacterium]|nr:helix-turn-helix domain-containing protein [Gemmatimonadaceae bacterium]
MGSPLIPLNNPARRVLEHLRHGPMTVEELASKIHVTTNAVRNQLARLLDANLVERIGSRPGTSKPSMVYAITLDGQVQFSTVYLPVLTQFLKTAEQECTAKELATFMTDTGKALAKRYSPPTGSLKARVGAAARLVRSLGGIPQVRSENGTVVIESVTCPLSALTRENAAACLILGGLVTEYVGAAAHKCCSQAPEPRCCFEINTTKKGLLRA